MSSAMKDTEMNILPLVEIVKGSSGMGIKRPIILLPVHNKLPNYFSIVFLRYE